MLRVYEVIHDSLMSDLFVRMDSGVMTDVADYSVISCLLYIIAEKARARGEDVRRSKGVVVIDPNVTNKTNHREN